MHSGIDGDILDAFRTLRIMHNGKLPSMNKAAGLIPPPFLHAAF